MRFVLRQLLAAAIRIEKKLDELLSMSVKTETKPGMLPPIVQALNSQGQVCPMCRQAVRYQSVQLPEPMSSTVTVRICGCEPQPTELPIQGEQQ